MKNPFNVSFGKKPIELLSRSEILENITDVFENDNPKTETYIITGPRGSGKTIALGLIIEHFLKKDDWIVVNLNPYLEIHEQIAARIYSNENFKKIFVKKELSIGFKGISFSISGEDKVKDIFTLLDKMFTYLKRKNIKLLFTIDDISNNENVRAFVYSFQGFLSKGFNVFLLATGLYKNVASLQNNKSLTFLIRAPKLLIKPLNIRAAYLSYKRLLNVSDGNALRLAKISNGYAFGFQLLGNIMFENNKTVIDDVVISQFDIELENKVYSMIWEDLTELEKKIVIFIAKHEGCDREIINSKLKLKGNSISSYKKSLINVGILSDENRGEFRFYLPRFKEFVLFKDKI